MIVFIFEQGFNVMVIRRSKITKLRAMYISLLVKQQQQQQNYACHCRGGGASFKVGTVHQHNSPNSKRGCAALMGFFLEKYP